MSALRQLHDLMPSSCPDASAPRPAVSRSDVSVQKVGGRDNVLYLPSARAARFKTWFAPVFAAWLRAHFPNPEQVAAAFGVRNSTAWNWWNGDNRASGDAVARMFIALPEAAQWFQREWERL